MAYEIETVTDGDSRVSIVKFDNQKNATGTEPPTARKMSKDPFSGVYGDSILEPPYDLFFLSTLPERSNILGQCIEAMETNIDGAGFTLEPTKTNIPNDAGEYSAEELARGVNLAENPNTPQAAQAREVEKLVELWRAKTQDFRNTFATELVFKLTSDDAANAAKVNAAMNKKGASYYTVKRCKDYLLYRNRKNEDLKDAALAIDKAYKAAQPKTRFYSIEKK